MNQALSITKSAFLMAIIIPLTSCVGGGGMVTAETAPQTLSVFTGILNKLPTGNAAPTMGSVFPSAKGLHVRSSPSSCYTTSPSPTVDDDADGIPLIEVTTYDCSDEISSEFSYTQKGTFTTQDKDDNITGLKGGYHFAFDIPYFYSTNTTNNLKSGASLKGSWDGSGTDTSSQFQSDFSGRVYGEFDINGEKMDFDFTLKYKWDVNYTHDSVSGSTKWSNGTMDANGNLEISGHFISEDKTGNHEMKDGSATLTWKTQDLVFDQSCTKFYKSGSVLIQDIGGNTIEIKYYCSEAFAYFNNTKMDTTF